ncbi:MAG: hypothetical protein B7X93_13840, partial [Hydrogenophilales bacterium 17-61-9]
FRAKHFTASDAPAMMGVSSYKSRSDLMKEKAIGVTQDVDAATQRLFDDGHRFEALARPLAEAIIGDDLYPVVGSDGKLAASFDGLTLCQSINFEHKTLNAAIEACQTADDLPVMYHVQVQQQMLVSGAERTLFMASRWDDNDQLIEKVEFWIERDEALMTGIKQGWEYFEHALSTYEHVEIIERPKGAAVLDLPAVMVNVSGQIAITDNLDKFTTALSSFIDTQLIKKPESDQDFADLESQILSSFIDTQLIKKPESDQDFADLESQIRTLKKAEEALDSAEVHMLAQVDSIDTAKRMIDLARNLARDNRLMAEKLVKSEKERIKTDRIMLARNQFMDHISALNAEIRPAQIEGVTPDFNGAAKNKRTMASLHDAIDTELARVKIESDAQAKGIRLNLALLKEHGKGYEFLFNDLAVIAHKESDDFIAVVSNRIASHKVAEAQKLEAERLRIQAEEEAKARAKVEAEQREAARVEANRLRAIAEADAAQKQADEVAAHKAAQAAEAERQRAQAARHQLLEAETLPDPATITEPVDEPGKTETVLIIRSVYQPEFIRKMVADSLAKYGVVVDSVELDEVVA